MTRPPLLVFVLGLWWEMLEEIGGEFSLCASPLQSSASKGMDEIALDLCCQPGFRNTSAGQLHSYLGEIARTLLPGLLRFH